MTNQVRIGWRANTPSSISYLISSLTSISKPILDSYTGSSVAYSLRKLKSTYTGYAIRVRRSSDNTETDIGFSGEALDTNSLLTFVGTGNGFVTTWYDQSLSAKNATQTTAANQPQIVSSGVVHLKNGKPSIYFSGNQMMVTTANVVSTGNQPYSIYGVSHNVGISSSTLFYIGSGSGNNGIGLQVITGGNLRHFWYTAEATNYPNTINNQYYYSIEFNGSNVYNSRNDSKTLVATGRTKNTLSPTLMIGKMVNWNEWYNGYHQELIIFDNYNTNEVSTGIRVNINTYYSSYTQDVNPLTAAAYSLRKLTADYTGSAIRVRRSGDNAEQNIGFKSDGSLDETTLTTFAGSNNTFLYSQDFDNAYWTKGGVSITANSDIAPDGTQTADLFQETAGNGQHYLSRTGLNVGFGVNSSWNMSLYIKKASNNTATSNKIMIRQAKTDYTDGGTTAVFNLDSGQVVYTAEGSVSGGTLGLIGATMSNEGNGWWRCSMWGKRPVATYGSQNAEVSIVIGKVPLTDNWGNVIPNTPGYQISWNGDTSGKYLIWGVQMTFKNNDTSYQTIKTYTKTTTTNPGSAYVTTWYDQSGNGRNVTQATAINQPPIIEDCTVVKLNSKPVLSFMYTGTTRRWLSMTWGSMTMNPPFSMFANIKLQGTISDVNLITGLETNKRFGISSFTVGNWTPSYSFWGSDNNYIGGQVANNNNSIHYVYTSALENTVLGVNGTSTTKYITPAAWRAISIGTSDSAQFYASEVLFFYGDKSASRSTIESNMNTFYSIY